MSTKTENVFMVMGRIDHTMEHFEKAASRGDVETVLSLAGRLSEQHDMLRAAILSDTLRASIAMVQEKRQNVVNGVFPTNENAPAVNRGAF